MSHRYVTIEGMEELVPLSGLRWPWVLAGRGELRGQPLRYLLTTLLSEAGGPLTVPELVTRCESEGVVFRGRASKIVSDALRWEIGWGRVVRIRRGVYRFASMPRSTQHWIARRVGEWRAYLLRPRVSGMASARPVSPWPSGAGFVT